MYALGLLLLSLAASSARSRLETIKRQYPSSQNTKAGGHRITVSDTIRMTKLGDASYFAGGSAQGRVGHLAPDGSKALVILRRGNLEKNTNDYSLLLWNTADLFSGGTPQLLLTMSSSSNRGGIADIRWLPDNRTITFLGEHPGEEHQLYEFDVDSRNLKKLTDHATSITSYSLTPDGNGIAYIAQAPAERLWNNSAERDGVVISSQSIADLIAGTKRDPWTDAGELYYQTAGRAQRMNLIGTLDARPGQSACFLSPDGKHIVASAKVPNADLPPSWKNYRNPSLEFNTRADRQRIMPVTSYFERYELIDTATGTSRILLDSPIWPPNQGVVWIPDGHSVVLSKVFLPYANVEGLERAERERHGYLVAVGVDDGLLTKIDDDKVEAVRWDAESNRLVGSRVAEDGVSDFVVFYTKASNYWRRSDESPGVQTVPELQLREGMQDSPKIFAIYPARHAESLLIDLNPQFDLLKFGKVEEIHWQWSKGNFTRAGLYYPPDYVPGRKYPLVIQTHGWSASRFWIDGPETTAYAAQPLAAKGIMVLQVDDEHLPWTYGRKGQRKEVEEALSIYETAIDHLDKKGLIDRRRIGILGFSHTCFYVKHALVHSRVKFAAASTTEGEDGGYLQFMTNGNLFVDAYSLYGGRPFGESLKSWLRISPGFNADKTHTPLRITTLRPEKLLLDWEWFEALTLLHKPVDMVMLKDGDHVLEKPYERLVSQEGNVDWFDFWLNRHEDGDSSKVEQYTRWRHLRELQKQSGDAN